MKFSPRLKTLMLHCVFPIFIGAGIYTFFRKKSILLFDWYESLGFLDLILSIRYFFNSQENIYSNFFTQSFPDGLWVYAFTYCLLIIWQGRPNSILYSITPLIIALISELGQYLSFVSGTYDKLDVITYIASNLIAITIFKFSNYEI